MLSTEARKTSTDLSAAIGYLSPEKQQLLVLRNPLSFAQQRLWLIDKLRPGSSAYSIPMVLRLTGRLDISALEQTLGEVVRRHESLRTRFDSIGGSPIQIVMPSFQIAIVQIDLSLMPSHLREDEAKRLAGEEARQGFDLQRGPLVRAKLIKCREQEHLFLLTMHHIISDGWSLGVLWRELATIYEAYRTARANPLKDLPIQYLDYVRWQRKSLRGEALAQQLDYWRRQLAGAPQLLELPVDYPRDPANVPLGGRKVCTLSSGLLADLRGFGRQTGATLYMVLLAAFQVVLSRYCGQEEFLIGSPVAGRKAVEVEELIGLFVNTVVLRANLAGTPSFRRLIEKVKETALGAYAHQDLPFEKLVEELQPERMLSHDPLIQVMFDLQSAPLQPAELPDLTLSLLEIGEGAAQFELSLSIIEEAETLTVIFDYDANLFENATIDQMADHFTNLLEAALAQPEARTVDLQIMKHDERRQLLIEWNDTGRPRTMERCIHQLIEEQAERNPEAVAWVYEQQQLTYGELNRRANQLAEYLISLGIKQESLVCISIERSIEMIIGIFAILKAGGAYVPIDPATPPERVRFILDDTRTPVLLTQSSLRDRVAADKCSVVCLDDAPEIFAKPGTANPVGRVTPENLAYIIYTSGSTGKPKGVMVQHDSLVAYIGMAVERYASVSGDRFLQFSSFSFDASVEDIFTPLTSGGTLVLRTTAMLAAPSTFLRCCSEMQISVLDLPTAYWHELVAGSSNEDWAAIETLRLMIIGGEKAQPERVREWSERVGERVRLINAYGPTETTISATMYEPNGPSSERRRTQASYIGRPVDNVQTYVLDPYGQPAPIGVSGELCIGGDGVARGYLNRPDLTAEKFIPNPFARRAGSRLYKSADSARHCRDGNLEFLGRVDRQVKIRGYRIELEEIEALLSSHPRVSDAVVVAREDSPGSARLIAYLVLAESSRSAVSELRDYLREKLPSYMTPANFVLLEKLPLTLHGKVDRRNLLNLALPVADEDEYTSPANALEEKIASVWAAILNLERIGADDNFFDLGGHSLLAIRAQDRLSRELGQEITLLKLFEHPTVRRLAQHLNDGSASPIMNDQTRGLARDLAGDLAKDWADRRKQALKRRRQTIRSLA